jgi:DNA-binding CsgD family transcriptional regulator
MRISEISDEKFVDSYITDIPADLNSEEALHYKKSIPQFPEEAVYIYSFKLNKMVYACGWEELLGYPDNQISMITISNITTPEYTAFSNELNDKALQFILSRRKSLVKYSFTIELKKTHKNGTEVPLVCRVGVHRAEKGRVIEIIGLSQINRSIKFGKVMRYAAYGPGKSAFEEELNKILFQYCAISTKEKEALELVSNGYSYKEIADRLMVTESTIAKRIYPLYERFGVKNLAHLIMFAYENQIIS